ncbi:MAG: prepilin-type N-terminal cleavage/methylation domain-containing protein [Crocinitomicaceae bacterium]|jgi:general secretion pathway protein J|nr:MAG: prepilin-type N-terminal cleavage/methylation domain-containing protein [Crocinitomicaceae bacterium]
MNRYRLARGFTLVEVLVAIAIFAVLSATGWMVFDQLIKNRERNQQHAEQLTQLQYAYAQMLRDLNQVVPIAGQEAGQAYPAFYLENQGLKLNKAGVSDPLQQGLDSLEYIEYRYDAEKQALMRYKQPYIYRRQSQNIQGDVILAPMSDLQFVSLNSSKQNIQNPPSDTEALTQLPQGVEVRFKYQEREYRWVFNLIQPLSDLNTETAKQGASNEKSS